MPELRLNLVTREWVIIATERAKRPEEFKSLPTKKAVPDFLKGCPFCPGNEEKTPKETFRIDGDKNWRIRVVQNKFAALSEIGEKKRVNNGIRRMVNSVGRHEVIIETPQHDVHPALLPIGHMEDLIHIYKNRFLDAYRDPRVEHVIIFKNHGERAGTSLEHPHSQLIATPVVPAQYRDRMEAATHYFDDTGVCLICDELQSELSEGKRIIMDTAHFVTFIPYAALSPFHTWIFPKRHTAAFSDITEPEIADLALHLKSLLCKLYYGLDNPDYNYVIRSAKPSEARNEYVHWYLAIVPRITRTAGFEIGSGIYINSSLPEQSAEFLKAVKIE